MSREGLNIFTDYLHNDTAIFSLKASLEDVTNSLKETESQFGEEVTIVQIMERNGKLDALNKMKEKMEVLEAKKTDLANQIEAFFAEFPNTKRISFKTSIGGTQPKEWFVIDMYLDKVRIQNVKA